MAILDVRGAPLGMPNGRMGAPAKGRSALAALSALDAEFWAHLGGFVRPWPDCSESPLRGYCGSSAPSPFRRFAVSPFRRFSYRLTPSVFGSQILDPVLGLSRLTRRSGHEVIR